MSSFLLNMPNAPGTSGEKSSPTGGPVQEMREKDDRKGKGRAEEWIVDQAQSNTGSGERTEKPMLAGEKESLAPGENLVKETTKAWIDPKALAQLIRAQTSSTAEDAQTRSGEEDLLSPRAETVEPASFVHAALEQVTEEIREVQAAAQLQEGKITLGVRKGFKRMGHRGNLVDKPSTIPIAGPSLPISDPEGDDNGQEEESLEHEQGDDYQSSVVESVRKDFSDFKEAMESFVWKIDKSMKQIDARLKALEGMPTPVREQGEVVSHRRVLSSETSPRPVAVYTPASGAPGPATQAIDTSFILKTRHTLSPAVQHSILTKNIGAKLADSLVLPIPKDKWTPSGLSQLISKL